MANGAIQPSDLSIQAVKLARRLQALARGIHVIVLVKTNLGWVWKVLGEEEKTEGTTA
jgi:hypothetical protein